MQTTESVRLILANGLRVVHIALWMTIPAAVWLWLVIAEPPSKCAPQYGWYRGNVLCVPEGIHLFLVIGLLLIGFFVVPFWIAGYGFAIIHRVLGGEKKLPPVRLSVIGDGYALFWTSLGYWLPAIAYILCIKAASHVLPHEAALQAFDTVMLVSSPLVLLMFWGYLVSLARYTASGERAWFCRRRESMRMALTNIRSTLALSISMTVTAVLSIGVLSWLFGRLYPISLPDRMVEAAVGSFPLILVLLCWIFACSRLVARYASKIGISDQLMPNAAYDWRRLDGQKRAACGVLE